MHSDFSGYWILSVMILTCKCMLLFNNQELAKLYNSIEMGRLGGHAGLGQSSKLLSVKMVFAYLCKVIEKWKKAKFKNNVYVLCLFV